MTGCLGSVAIALVGVAFMAADADARITHIEITKTEAAFGGQSFDDAGVYERLICRVTGELDPPIPITQDSGHQFRPT